ncbi:hypothetical protein C5167_003398 [Papaver somniferum]|uniref:RRM domain-containing protein n=1 Tax=Papaver somniferum TaxID=3469 RepID=A0A4Y7KXZ5_PAPSO|nr:29 kDa ribonucleoprotein A, chloroplastic-like [Papaver somniferum]RZC76961.1 hypothetical protein C5167_003398 [Papaver somniferum]
MASSSLVLPSISIKTLVLSKTGRNTCLSLPSSTLCLSSSLKTKPISISSSFPSNKGCSSSRFVTRVAAEFDQASSGRDETNFSPDLKIFVGNLPFSVESADLAELFEQAGSVEMVEVIYDKISGRSRGFGFVTMSSTDEVKAAVEQFNGYEIDGRQLRVNSGPPPPKDDYSSRPPRIGGGGGGSGGFDSSNRCYVGNLSWGVDDLALETLFNEQGKVLEAKVVYDRETGRSRGFGFVTYGSAEEVQGAIDSLDGADLNGRSIRVSVAEARQRRQF